MGEDGRAGGQVSYKKRAKPWNTEAKAAGTPNSTSLGKYPMAPLQGRLSNIWQVATAGR